MPISSHARSVWNDQLVKMVGQSCDVRVKSDISLYVASFGAFASRPTRASYCSLKEHRIRLSAPCARQNRAAPVFFAEAIAPFPH